MQRSSAGMADAQEKRVAPLELFFDLVFVFAITQVTALMADDPSWTGLGRGMLVLACTLVGLGGICVADELHRPPRRTASGS